MDTNTLFLTATREKFRFQSTVGLVSIEDLWDMPLTSTRGPCLDDIAKTLNRAVKAADDDVSFVRPAATNKKGDDLQAKFDIVKHIIEVKLAERDAAKAAEDKKAEKQRLLELIAKKKDQALEGLTIEELTARINAL